MNPKIIVGGYPNSGTSFLTNLIVQLGYSPGNTDNLKKGDTHNRWGYFEHVELRNLVHNGLGLGHFKGWKEDFKKTKNPVDVVNDVRKKVLQLADRDGIEVVKDNALAITYSAYPRDSKYIIIERDIIDIYNSPIKAGFPGYPYEINQFKELVSEYKSYTYSMSLELDTIILQYKDFGINFNIELNKICNFLQLDYPSDPTIYKAIFKPRKKSSNLTRILNKLKVMSKL